MLLQMADPTAALVSLMDVIFAFGAANVPPTAGRPFEGCRCSRMGISQRSVV